MRYPQENRLLSSVDGVLRRGWLLRGIPHWEAETVAEHSRRVANMAYLFTGDERAYGMGIVHDLGESDGIDSVPGEEHPDRKRAREWRNIMLLTAHMDGFGTRVRNLWVEFDEQQTPLARIVRDIDKIDPVAKAMSYDQQDGNGFALTEEFYTNARPTIRNARLREILDVLYAEREAPNPLMRLAYRMR